MFTIYVESSSNDNFASCFIELKTIKLNEKLNYQETPIGVY